jgi:hypothetical protein
MGWFGSNWFASRWWASWWWGKQALDEGNLFVEVSNIRSVAVSVADCEEVISIEAANIVPSISVSVETELLEDLDGMAGQPACAINYDKIQIGNTARSTGTFRDSGDDDAAVDPESVFVVVREPSGVETEYEYDVDAAVVRDSVGVYRIDIVLDQAGYWYFRWHSGGTRPASTEKTLNVTSVETY